MIDRPRDASAAGPSLRTRMIKFILKRLSLLIPTLFGVVTLVFAMIALAPGDPAQAMLGERASKQAVERLRRDLGLDRPLIEQYASYLKRVAVLDFQR
jgi:ABC-type dipeptide/oligopeptide/nickel transport system permease component